MTDIVTGTVVHFITNPANPAGPPILDPNATKQGIIVTLADGSNDCVAELAIVSKYVKEIPDLKAAGATLDQDRQQMLIDASKGWVRVLDLRRTRIQVP